MTPAQGIEAILIAEGVLGGVTGWTSTVGGLVDTGKNVTLIDSGGRGGEVKVAIDYPSVQAIVQGSKTAGGYVEAYAKAMEVYTALQGIPTPHADWPKLTSCVALNMPVWMGRDDRDRPRFSLNFRLITTPENEGNRTY